MKANIKQQRIEKPLFSFDVVLECGLLRQKLRCNKFRVFAYENYYTKNYSSRDFQIHRCTNINEML